MRLNLCRLLHHWHYSRVIRNNHWHIVHMRCYSMVLCSHRNSHRIICKTAHLTQLRSSLLNNFTYLTSALHHQRHKSGTHLHRIRYRFLMRGVSPLTIYFPRLQFGSPHIRCGIRKTCPQRLAESDLASKSYSHCLWHQCRFGTQRHTDHMQGGLKSHDTRRQFTDTGQPQTLKNLLFNSSTGSHLVLNKFHNVRDKVCIR